MFSWRKARKAKVIEYFSPDETFPAPQLSLPPVRFAPVPRAWVPLAFGDQPERAFASAFIRLCAEAGEWRGLLRADVLTRLHDEVKRSRQGLPCIPSAGLFEELPEKRDEQVRTFMYLQGRAVCVDGGLLRAELLGDREVLYATERLIQAIGEPEHPEDIQLVMFDGAS